MCGGGNSLKEDLYLRSKSSHFCFLRKISARQNNFQVLPTFDSLKGPYPVSLMGCRILMAVSFLWNALPLLAHWSMPPVRSKPSLILISSEKCLMGLRTCSCLWISVTLSMQTFVDCSQKAWVWGTTHSLNVSVGKSHCFSGLCFLICEEGW